MSLPRSQPPPITAVDLELLRTVVAALDAAGIAQMLTGSMDSLDRPYLDRWARELGASDLLAQVWDEAVAS